MPGGSFVNPAKKPPPTERDMFGRPMPPKPAADTISMGRGGVISIPKPKPAAPPPSTGSKLISAAGGMPGAHAGGPATPGGKPAGVPVTAAAAAVQRAAEKVAAEAPAQLTTPPPEPIKPVAAVKVTPTAPIKIDTSGLEGEFASARDRASRREGAALQGQRDAIARRAAMGGGPSGALQKQENLAADASAQRLGDVNAEIDAVKTGELRKARDLETQLNFTAQQNDIQRQYAAEEAAAGRQASADALNADVALKQRAMEIQQSQFGKTLAQSLREFDWQQHIDEKNLEIAARIQRLNEQEDPGLLGMGGMLGTGINGSKGLLGTGILAG